MLRLFKVGVMDGLILIMSVLFIVYCLGFGVKVSVFELVIVEAGLKVVLFMFVFDYWLDKLFGFVKDCGLLDW